ncbi:MAG: MBL fold metallo-hydrolase [Deltaproteobacteria bacterium]|nr:MBL fold metallo-hydrolase [Deltaproteobacteria bacterium]
MDPIEAAKDLFFIERGFLSGNHFAYRADAPVLIDTAYASELGKTKASLERLGIDWGRTRLIVNTHCHCDHVGANRVIQEASGCEVALHPAGRGYVEKADRLATWWDYYDQEAEFFDCARSLADGEILAVGPHELEVLHSPGHSADGIVLYHRREKALFSSDTLLEAGSTVATLRLEGQDSVSAWLASLERIEALDVRVAFPGHGRPFSSIREAVARTKRRLEGYLTRPESVGDDLLKRILVYTLLMRPRVGAAALFDRLMGTRWFPDTIDTYFEGEYRRKYDEVLRGLLERSIVRAEAGTLVATVKP